MDLQLKDRTVVVTGASSGVGLATARYLLSEGARVAACARDLGRLTAAFDEFSWADKDSIHLASCDVTDQEATNAFIAGTLDRFGAMDGLVCNAGRSLMATLQETTDQQLRDEFGFEDLRRPQHGAVGQDRLERLRPRVRGQCQRHSCPAARSCAWPLPPPPAPRC